MNSKLMTILLLIATILVSGGCSAKKIDVKDVKFRTEQGNTLPNNLRLTLALAPDMKALWIDPYFGEIPPFTAKTTSALKKVAPEVFGRIGSISDDTAFAPHLIAHVKDARCEKVDDFICRVSVDLYRGNGEFIRTFEGKGKAEFTLDPVAESTLYNAFAESSRDIINQMLGDSSLVPYFERGFDESSASADPDIPQIPYLQSRIQKRMEEAKRKERKKQLEANRPASEAILAKVRTRGYALEEEIDRVLSLGPVPSVLDKFILESLLPFQDQMNQAIEQGSRPEIKSVSQNWREWLERSEPYVSQEAKESLVEQLSYLDKLDDRLGDLALDEQLAGIVNPVQPISDPLPLATPGTKERLAVMELESFGGVSELLVEVLTNTLKDDLHATGSYSIISREEIEALANRLALQQKTGACTSSDCLADMGKALGTKLMVYGSISKIGRTYSLSLRLLDTDTKEAIRRVNERCKCSDEELFDTVQKAAVKLMGRQ